MATKCPKCQFENLDDTSYCGKCATPLAASAEALGSLTRIIDAAGRDLATGTLIAAKYRIIDKLGAGGMGEVYRAEDLSLNRQVAIKVLPAVFATDRERLARFEREAKILASLNHPNIAAIYGVEQADAKRFLVLELIEGETLSERLLKGRISPEETLEICRQIAEGLESAHEKGIIHRDLKPSNVKITPQGKVKILDFGLARAFHDQISDVDLAKSPTITADMTRPGVILGTAAYMSPEQAKGKPVDKRADIWAFGCILYECLTGRRAFAGDTVTETLALILKGEPDWNILPQATPRVLLSLIKRCLQKDPGRRAQCIGDVRIEAEEALSLPEIEQQVPATPVLSRWPRTLLWSLTALIVFVLGAWLSRLFWRGSQLPPQISRFDISLPPDVSMATAKDYTGIADRTSVAISADGKRLAVVGASSGIRRLYVRKQDEFAFRPLSGTEGAADPFFSPSGGEYLGFFAEDKLKKVPFEGGTPIVLCVATNSNGGVWMPDNFIIFSSYFRLYRVSAAGGQEQVVYRHESRRTGKTPYFPRLHLDGKSILATGWPLDTIEILAPGRQEFHTLWDMGTSPYITPTGHLVYAEKGLLLAAPFDLKRMQVSGDPKPVLDELRTAQGGVAQFALSDEGTLFYAAGQAMDEGTLVSVDRNGLAEDLGVPRQSFLAIDISPEGRRIAWTAKEGPRMEIRSYDLQRGSLSRLTSEPGNNTVPRWNPNGTEVAFSVYGPNIASSLYFQGIDGASKARQILAGEYTKFPVDWSPDGRLLLFSENDPETQSDLWYLEMGENPSPRVFLKSNGDEGDACFSPDGHWVAYNSDKSGHFEIYVRSFPDGNREQQISSNGGSEPRWSPDGKEIFYRNGNSVMVVGISVRPDLNAAAPKLLFQGDYLTIVNRSWDIMPDGQHFIMIKPAHSDMVVTELRLVQNWFEELKRLVPSGKK